MPANPRPAVRCILRQAGSYASDAPILALCVAKSGPVKTAKDLEGGTIALVALKSITEAAVREWIAAQSGADLRAQDQALAEMPVHAEMAPALGARDDRRRAFLGEPFLSAAKDDVRILGRSYDVVAPSFYISAWFASRDWIAKNPETVRKLSAALYDTARWANGHHDETAPILAKYAKLDLARIRAMNRTTYVDLARSPNLMQPDPRHRGAAYPALIEKSRSPPPT